jgi:hypothetical protein
MDIAEQIASLETEPLPWAEICARYPDEYVCLVEIVHAPWPKLGHRSEIRPIA